MEIKRLDLAKPVMAQFELTHLCNHRCPHCYRFEHENHQSIENVSDNVVIEVSRRLAEAKIFNVVVTGGEPLIKPGLTKQVIDILLDSNVQVGLNTNITLLPNDFLEYLSRKEINVLTSCPSSNREKFNRMVGANKYDIFFERLNKLLEAGIHCTVNMVVNKENHDHVRQTATFLREKGCYSFSATPMFLNMESPQKELLLSREEVMNVVEDLLWVESNLNMKVDILESLPKCVFSPSIRNSSYTFLNRKCQAGRTVVGVSPNGDVRPCSTNTISYGNILHEDIRDIWRKMAIWRSADYFPEQCKNCSWIERCNAGCRINSKAFWGQWNASDIWMGEPIGEPPEADYQFYNFTEDSKIQLNKNYCYREEYDDVFVIFNKLDESFMMVNKDLLDFIISLDRIHFTTIGDLANAYNTQLPNKDFSDIINLLINKNILNYEI